MVVALPTLYLGYMTSTVSTGPNTVYLKYPPTALLTVGSDWDIILPHLSESQRGSITHIRLITTEWIEYTIWWPELTTFSYFLTDHRFVTPEQLHFHSALILFQELGRTDSEHIQKIDTSGYTRPVDHPIPAGYTIEVISQALSVIPGHPSTWTLAATPVALAIGHFVTVRENHWEGQVIGVAKITVIYALEQSWVELGLQLTKKASRCRSSALLRVTAPLTHVVLPPHIYTLHRQLKPHLPEILALSHLPRPCPIAHVVTRTHF